MASARWVHLTGIAAAKNLFAVRSGLPQELACSRNLLDDQPPQQRENRQGRRPPNWRCMVARRRISRKWWMPNVEATWISVQSKSSCFHPNDDEEDSRPQRKRLGGVLVLVDEDACYVAMTHPKEEVVVGDALRVGVARPSTTGGRGTAGRRQDQRGRRRVRWAGRHRTAEEEPRNDEVQRVGQLPSDGTP